MNRRTRLLIGMAVMAVFALPGLIGMDDTAGASPPAGASSHVGGDGVQGARLMDDPYVANFNCADISRLNVDKQLNIRAWLILQKCGYAPPGSGNGTSPGVGTTRIPPVVRPLAGPLFGGTDVDAILPDGAYPSVTQSEAMSWAHGSMVVINYNDFRALPCFSGLAYSTDGGVTFQHTGQPLCSGHGNNYGDPIVLYNAALSKWYAGDLVAGCGGLGVGLWTSADGIAWSPGVCAHSNSADDRESFWVDNNPASPHYGRMYISFNDHNLGGTLQVVYSDDGTDWSSPVTLAVPFLIDVQVTGDLQGSGKVYVAAMDLEGGGLTNHTNYMFRSTDGGVTWASSIMGADFQAPGRSASGFFTLAFSTTFRELGFGQPAAVGNNVYYDWAQCGQNVFCSGATDHGDIYFQRSTDSGETWSSPLKLNTDRGTAMQWQPSLATTISGAVYAGWYDEREANGGGDLDCTAGNVAQPCYRRWGRVSPDGGATWQSDAGVGDALSPLPVGPQQNTLYAGDYDYISSDGDTIYDHWTDGRVAINNTPQQDVFLDRINAQALTPTPTFTGTPPTNTPTSEVPTSTPTAGQATASATPSPTPIVGVTNTPTPCSISFSDVHESDYFYPAVAYLYCHGVISGYADGTFRPYNNTTRGQLTKMVVLAEGWPIVTPTGTPTFSDVPPDHPFYQYVETAVSHQIISGYSDGTFRPGNDVTRGQLTKIIVLAQGWQQVCPPPGHFSDVPPDNPFFCFVETAYLHSIISGYSDGTFRPGNPATRGQISKIVYNAVARP